MSSRNTNDLDPTFARRAKDIMAQAGLQLPPGDTAIITITKRDPAEQALAFASNLSNAPAGQSYHEYGLAFDFAILRHGHYVTRGDDPSYALVGGIAQEEDCCWGGAWHHPDQDHIEFHPPALSCHDAIKLKRPETA